MIGSTIGGKYRIERLLGSGGMGSVYAARDEGSGQAVAVKVIHGNLPDVQALLARFDREARAASSVDTIHIARCLDAGTDAQTGSPFMVLELLEGEDLQHILRREGPLAPQTAIRVVAQACVGLARAHEAGIVHRDIKPANLFVARDPAGKRIVKILDFGVAKVANPSDVGGDAGGLTRTGSILGSPLYMSPEQARSVKSVDPRSDIWSIGVVLYQALAGRTPYEHISGLGDLILALCSDLPPPIQQFAPWIEPELAAVVDRCLRIDLRERYQTAGELADALKALSPGSIDLDDSMLVKLDAAARSQAAPTYFRGPVAARSVPFPQSMALAGTLQQEPTHNPAPMRATSEAPPAIATTGPGLATSTGDRAPPQPQSRTVPMIAVAIACLAGGGAAVWAFSRPHGQAAMPPPPVSAPPAVSAPQVPSAAPPPPPASASAAPAPTVTPAPSVSASASVTATVSPGKTQPAVPVSVKPKASAAPAASASAPPKQTNTDHSSFGDRQ